MRFSSVLANVAVLLSLADFASAASCDGANQCQAASTTCIDDGSAQGYHCQCKKGFKTCEQASLGESDYTLSNQGSNTGMYGLMFEVKAKHEDVIITNFGFQFNGGYGS